jgi:hypothetical protein
MGLWVVSSEHRAAPALSPVNLELVTTNADTTHLEVVSEIERVLNLLGFEPSRNDLLRRSHPGAESEADERSKYRSGRFQVVHELHTVGQLDGRVRNVESSIPNQSEDVTQRRLGRRVRC